MPIECGPSFAAAAALLKSGHRQESIRSDREVDMFWKMVALLFLCWAVGFAVGVSGSVIHLLLVIAGMLLLGKLLEPRRMS